MSFPIKITELAIQKMIAAKVADPELTDEHFIRISVKGGGCSGFQNDLNFDNEFDPEEDEAAEYDSGYAKIKVVIDCASAAYLDGSEIDYEINDMSEGFKFNDILGKIKKTCACGSSVSY